MMLNVILYNSLENRVFIHLLTPIEIYALRIPQYTEGTIKYVIGFALPSQYLPVIIFLRLIFQISIFVL